MRGPLLSSVIMVMLATAATGLLAVVGFQAIPETVVPSTFGGEHEAPRRVDVTEAPSVDATHKTVAPAPTAGPTDTEVTHRPRTRPTSTATAAPKTAATTTTAPKSTTAPKKTTSPKPSASPSPSPSPTSTSPDCQRHPEKPKCHPHGFFEPYSGPTGETADPKSDKVRGKSANAKGHQRRTPARSHRH